MKTSLRVILNKKPHGSYHNTNLQIKTIRVLLGSRLRYNRDGLLFSTGSNLVQCDLKYFPLINPPGFLSDSRGVLFLFVLLTFIVTHTAPNIYKSQFK